DVLAECEINPLVQSRSQDRSPQVLMVFIMKTVAGELSLYFIGQGYKKSRDNVKEKIHELIVCNNDQNIRPGCLQIRAQNRKGSLRIVPECPLLFESRFRIDALRGHGVVEFHKIFPLITGLQKDIGGMTRGQC